MKNEVTAKRLQLALSRINMKAQELAEASGVNKASISQYVNGSHAPSNISAGKMASVLKVNPVWLMGFDVPMLESGSPTPPHPSLRPVSTQRFKVLGSVACGEPVFMAEEVDVTIDVDNPPKADYVLTAKGDSMINIGIHDGDIIFVKEQPTVENGQVAVVALGDEACLKRFYYYQEKSLMILKSENPAYQDIIKVGPELEDVRVLGRAVKYQGTVR